MVDGGKMADGGSVTALPPVIPVIGEGLGRAQGVTMEGGPIGRPFMAGHAGGSPAAPIVHPQIIHSRCPPLRPLK